MPFYFEPGWFPHWSGVDLRSSKCTQIPVVRTTAVLLGVLVFGCFSYASKRGVRNMRTTPVVFSASGEPWSKPPKPWGSVYSARAARTGWPTFLKVSSWDSSPHGHRWNLIHYLSNWIIIAGGYQWQPNPWNKGVSSFPPNKPACFGYIETSPTCQVFVAFYAYRLTPPVLPRVFRFAWTAPRSRRTWPVRWPKLSWRARAWHRPRGPRWRRRRHGRWRGEMFFFLGRFRCSLGVFSGVF